MKKKGSISLYSQNRTGNPRTHTNEKWSWIASRPPPNDNHESVNSPRYLLFTLPC